MISDMIISNNRQSSNSLFDYIYYSAVVITTIGFGDITPISMLVRTLTVIEAFIGLIIMGLFLAKAFESKPAMNNVQLQAELQKYARDLGETGRDHLYGYGVVSLVKATAPTSPRGRRVQR